MKSKVCALAFTVLSSIFLATGCGGSSQQSATAATSQNSVEDTLHEAEALIYDQQYKDAVALITSIIEYEGPSAYTLTLRGISYAKMNKPYFAISDLIEATKIEYTPETLVNLGNVERMSGYCERAADAYQKALLLAPNDSQILVNLGSSYVCYGANDLAETALMRAYKINPDDSILMTNIAQLHSTRKNWAEARSAAEKAIALDASYAPAYKVLALVCGEQGDRTCAKEAQELYNLQSKPKTIVYRRRK